MEINHRAIGQGHPAYIIAELSANHIGDISIARETIRMARDAGADAVKLQTYTPDTITIDCDNQYFQINQGTIWDGTTLYELYQQAYTPMEWQAPLFAYGKELGITVFSSPFDKTAVDLLEKLDAPAYKIASFEINDIPLIHKVASLGKPVILSTGVARLQDIDLAIRTCLDTGNTNIALLQCTSTYPTPLAQVNLRTMQNMRETFGVTVGLSDHTLGNAVSVAAIALGASIIERHVILDKDLGGPDAAFSLDASEFRSLVADIRAVEEAMGRVTYELTDKQMKSREHARSLFVVRDVQKGECITEDNVRSIRPAFGMHTKHYTEVLGRRLNADLPKGTPLDWRYIE